MVLNMLSDPSYSLNQDDESWTKNSMTYFRRVLPEVIGVTDMSTRRYVLSLLSLYNVYYVQLKKVVF